MGQMGQMECPIDCARALEDHVSPYRIEDSPWSSRRRYISDY